MTQCLNHMIAKLVSNSDLILICYAIAISVYNSCLKKWEIKHQEAQAMKTRYRNMAACREGRREIKGIDGYVGKIGERRLWLVFHPLSHSIDNDDINFVRRRWGFQCTNEVAGQARIQPERWQNRVTPIEEESYLYGWKELVCLNEFESDEVWRCRGWILIAFLGFRPISGINYSHNSISSCIKLLYYCSIILSDWLNRCTELNVSNYLWDALLISAATGWAISVYGLIIKIKDE